MNDQIRRHVRRHMIIPDVQLRPGDDLSHLDWAAQAVIEYRPDVLIIIGDFGDFRSLSSWEKPGSLHTFSYNVQADYDIFNEGMHRLLDPVDARIALLAKNNKRRWYLQKEFLLGNHEDRISRAISSDPKLDGLLSLDKLDMVGCRRHPYLKIVNIDGIKYCHYFPNPLTGKPIGGTVHNRLNHIGSSFVQGHQQGFLYASKQYPDHVKHGIVCGRYYQHHEHYRAEDVQNTEWNGIVVLNQVCNGDFDHMGLRMDYLREKYGK